MDKVYSFDVFDTSLIRKVAAPSDVFRVVGSCIAENSGLSDDRFIEDFVAARVMAEGEASFSDDQATLGPIWTKLHELLPRLPLHFGPQDELNAEQSLLAPNAVVVQRISELRAAGHRIIFASDTHFTREFVREQLLRHGVAQGDDHVYVSSGRNHTKFTGELFKTILAREGISASALHHYGDNPHSDFDVPRRLGIGATLLDDTHLNTWERGILSKDISHRWAMASLAGSMRAFRLSTAEKLTSADELVATFLGPALTVWAAWVLGAAQRDGIRRLYFVSRDAYLLYRAARTLAPQFGNIECRDLRLSRQTTLLPSTDEISPSGMKWLGSSGSIRRLGPTVERLGLKWCNVAEHFSSLAASRGESKLLTSEEDWSAFWNIVQRSPIVDMVRENIETKRADLVGYLRWEGLYEDVPAALVDLGWRASAQACLRKVLGHAKQDSTLSGYYLGLGSNRMPPAAAGTTTALFYQEAADHTSISPRYEVFSRIDILENVVGLAPFGTVCGYQRTDSAVIPICDTGSALHVEFVAKVGDSLERYCRTYNDVSAYADLSIAREAINSLIATWSAHPSKSVLAALAHVVIVDGMRSDSEPLVLHWRLVDAAVTLIPSRWHERFRISRRISLWPEAATSTLFARCILMLSAMVRALTGKRFDWGPLPRWDKPN